MVRLNSEKSLRKAEGEQEISCGTCAFFGKPIFCLRRETYTGAIPCSLYERKIEATSPIYPLIPDIGIREPKEETLEKPSLLWCLVPFFFGILGGIVAYVAVKDKDEDMAFGLLAFGIIWTVIEVILYFAIISYYLSMLF